MLLIGALLIFESILATKFSTFNLGIVLPAILGLPLFLWALFYWPLADFLSQGIGRMIKIAIITAYFIFISGFCIFLFFMFRAEKRKVEPGADAVIVLGAGLRGENVSSLLAMRLNKAYDYWLESPNTLIVVSGGQGFQEVRPEAEAMEEYLLQKGVPPEMILKEDKATSTRENFAFSKTILDARFGEGTYRTLFVTSGFHVLRAGKIAEKAGLYAEGIGSAYSWSLALNNYLREYIATVQHIVFGHI